MPIGRRELFSQLRYASYANHASIGPLPDPARDAMEATLRCQSELGVGVFNPAMKNLATTRENLGKLLGVHGDDIALLGNTSDGVVLVAQGLQWAAGDHVLLFRGEFPANTTPWLQAAAQHQLVVHWLDAHDFADPEVGLAQVDALMKEHPIRLIACSAVQFQTGLRMPVEALGERVQAQGGQLFVDGIQALGAVPIDLTHVDYLASGGQKWLMGPIGASFLWMPADRWSALVPTAASWLSHENPFAILGGAPDQLRYDRPYVKGPGLVEGGTRGLHAHSGLGVSVACHLEIGVPNIFAHIQQWHDALEPELLARGCRSARSPHLAARSGILSVCPPDPTTVGALAAHLQGESISTGTPDGWLRFSPSWPNSLDEVPLIVRAIDRFVGA